MYALATQSVSQCNATLQVVSLYAPPAGGPSLRLSAGEFEELWSEFIGATRLNLSDFVKDHISLTCDSQVNAHVQWRGWSIFMQGAG